MNSIRIAIGGILTECNSFGGSPIELDCFTRYELLKGDEILDCSSGVLGGMLSVLHRQDAVLTPLLFASTCPGGPLTDECYSVLKDDLLARLKAVLPVSGVLMPLHGAMTIASVFDPEGDLIESVRQMIGPGIPIVVTLDLHAVVTAKMVRAADALVAWETYPHRDTYETGVRASQLLMKTIVDDLNLQMAMARVPVLTSAIHGSTDGDGPFARLMRKTKRLEEQTGILSSSLFLGYPYMDVPEMGSGCLIVGDGSIDNAKSHAIEIANYYWDSRWELEPIIYTPREAIQLGRKIDGGPIVLVEAADCCGGGAAGDSVATLRAMMDCQIRETAMVPVVDALAAQACCAAGVGERLELRIGHQHDPRWGEPINVAGKVTTTSDGRFVYRGGIWDGVQGNMGPSAVLDIGCIQILLMTHATYDWADEQFRSLGLDPQTAKFVVAKNPMNFRNVYEKTSPGIFVLDTLGPTPATVANLSFRIFREPFFPKDPELEIMRPTVVV